jgi:hypothetical protein
MGLLLLEQVFSILFIEKKIMGNDHAPDFLWHAYLPALPVPQSGHAHGDVFEVDGASHPSRALRTNED